MTQDELDDTGPPGPGVSDESSVTPSDASLELSAGGPWAAPDLPEPATPGPRSRSRGSTEGDRRSSWRRRVQGQGERPPDPEDAPIGSGVLDGAVQQPDSVAAEVPSWPTGSWSSAPGDFRLTAPDDGPDAGEPLPIDETTRGGPGGRTFPPPWARKPAIIAAGAIGGVLVLAVALVLGPLRPSSATAVLPTPRAPSRSLDPAASVDPGVAARTAFLARIVDPTFTYRMVWSGRVAGPGDRSSFKGTYDVAGRDYSARLSVAGRGTTRIIFKGKVAFTKRGSRPWTRVTTGFENLRQYPFLGIARADNITYVGPVHRIVKKAPAGSPPAAAGSGAPNGSALPGASAVPGASPSTSPASPGPSGSAEPQVETLYLLRSTGSYRPNRERMLNMSYLRWPTNRILLEILVRADGTPVSATFRLEAGGTTGSGKPQFVGTGSWTFSRVGDPIVVKAPGT